MKSPSFRHFVEQELGKFPFMVIYAVLEWVLIAVLFLDGLLAFAANELARIFEMEVPCLLCTRIDHVFVRRRPDFYCNDSLCESHKKDVVSFLAYCHVHRKLSDIRHMCQKCLLSSVTAKDSGCDTYKSLVGLLHRDLECLVEDDDRRLNLKLHPGVKAEEIMVVERTTTERCSCCAEFLKIKSSFVKRGFNNAAGLGATMNDSFTHSQAPTPTPRALAGSGMSKNEDIHGLELPHIRYSELKFPSEIPEDDFGSNALMSVGREDKAASMPLIPDSEYLNEEISRTPNSTRGNRFFGFSLPDSASSSPRWSSRFQRKPTLEKSELGLDSTTEGNLLNDLDPDSILHHLKRQVRLDRKSLIAMYMELDEERSASAVAANNAMAMITRLQAEKAAVQMEALQYQRMMEEQAEYDQEALQMMKDMLEKREIEVKELEAELINYREKYGHAGKAHRIERSASKSGTNGSLSENSMCGSPPFSVHERDNNEHGFNGAAPSDSGSSQDENERLDDKMSDFEDRANVAS